MNKEEIRHLKLFLNRTQTAVDRKDIILFDFIRKQRDAYNEAKIVERLYGKQGKNAFYRLKNRLTEDIGKSLILQYFNGADGQLVLHFISLSRHFRAKRIYKLAFYYLKKAERKANEQLDYELLNIIFTDFIRLSHESLSVNPAEYIAKREKIQDKVAQIRQIDNILATLTYQIKKSANYTRQDKSILDVMQQTVNQFTNDPELKSSPVLRFKIYHAVSRILLQQRDYQALEDYLVTTIATFKEEGLFAKHNHDTRLQMLVYLANCLFKNHKLKAALACCEELRLAMEEYSGILKGKYLIYYYNALINNYSVLNKSRALEILEEAAQNPVIVKTPLSTAIFKGQMAQLHFDLGNFKQANRSIIQMKLDEGFEHLDLGFQLKIHVAELLVRYELENMDFIEYRIAQLEKQFVELLRTTPLKRQERMLKIIAQMTQTTQFKRNTSLIGLIKDQVNDVTDEQASDLDWINYNDWLKSKVSI